MIMKKLSEEHYIVMDDSEIKEGDWIGFPNLKKFVPVQYFGGDLTGGEKKITHSTNIDWNEVYYIPLSEVKELLGVVDVEKKAQIEWGNVHRTGVLGYIDGYNQALEDNKDKKYTEEDLRKAISETRRGMLFLDKYVDEFIQSLKPQTEWEVEFVDGKLKIK